jgi:hypothetical protein
MNVMSKSLVNAVIEKGNLRIITVHYGSLMLFALPSPCPADDEVVIAFSMCW